MGWKEFSADLEENRDRCLSNAVALGRLNGSVPAVVWRALDPMRETQQRQVTSARESLHTDDRPAHHAYKQVARATGRERDLKYFAAFLRDLRSRGLGMGWNDFCLRTLDSDRERYLRDAVAEGRLTSSAPAAVRRAISAHHAVAAGPAAG